MKERPILFSTDMVQAISEGRKTQTRRVVRRPDIFSDKAWFNSIPHNTTETSYKIAYLKVPYDELKDISGYRIICPYGQVGDRLWVKETFKHYANKWDGTEWKSCITYKAGNVTLYDSWDKNEPPREKWWNKSTILDQWQPSIFMPRWASRITLEITDIRVERLQDITEEDAKAEGMNKAIGWMFGFVSPETDNRLREIFRCLWNKINGKKHSWESNPFVWVIEFKRR